MNWLTNIVRPKIKAIVGRDKPDVPDNLWTKCPGCGQAIFHRDLMANAYVCGECGYHLRLPVDARLTQLLDEGFSLCPLPAVAQDPLKFKDSRRYSDRIKDYRTKTQRQDALVVASGSIQGYPVVVAAFDFSFMGGSMGSAVGEGFIAAAEKAVSEKAALIAIPSSGGARMQEGILSLMQLPRTVIAVQRVKDAGLPYFVLFADPTTGGVSASFAMLGDIHLAEPGATIGFAGRRVIEQTVRESLPEGFQTAEYLLDHGMIDTIAPRPRQREIIARLLGLLGVAPVSGQPAAKALPSRNILPLTAPPKKATPSASGTQTKV